MDYNFKQNEDKEKTRLEILRNLLERTPLEILEKKVSVKRSTLFKYLTPLEKEGLIERIFQDDKRKRIFKITSKGKILLNELDNETKNRMFTNEVFRDINKFCIFSMLNHPDCFLNKGFYESLERRIGEAVLFAAIKQMDEPETLHLTDMPQMFSMIFKATKIPPEQLKSLIADNIITKQLESHYSESRKITPDNYKKMIAMDIELTNIIKSMSDVEKQEAQNVLKKIIDKIKD